MGSHTCFPGDFYDEEFVVKNAILAQCERDERIRGGLVRISQYVHGIFQLFKKYQFKRNNPFNIFNFKILFPAESSISQTLFTFPVSGMIQNQEKLRNSIFAFNEL